MKKISIISFVLSVAMIFGTVASAATFSDMPQDQRAQTVIENAVKNGLLSGYTDGTVKPDAYITRAEMASIITRACGANKEGDLSKFTDLDPNAWYYSAVAKAYEMGALSGSNGKMSPNDNITFQECFTVLSQVFDLVPNYILKDSIEELPANTIWVGRRLYDLSPVAGFSDATSVAEWAIVYVTGIVANGGWNGINNMLTPTENITRLQFATVMDNLFKNYIDEPGTYNSLPEGNTLIRCDGVVLENVTTDSDIYVADGVSANSLTVKNVKSKRFVIRGCATPVEKENGKITYGACGISISGEFDQVRIIRPYINLNMLGAKCRSAYSVKNTRRDAFPSN